MELIKLFICPINYPLKHPAHLLVGRCIPEVEFDDGPDQLPVSLRAAVKEVVQVAECCQF